MTPHQLIKQIQNISIHRYAAGKLKKKEVTINLRCSTPCGSDQGDYTEIYSPSSLISNQIGLIQQLGNRMVLGNTAWKFTVKLSSNTRDK